MLKRINRLTPIGRLSHPSSCKSQFLRLMYVPNKLSVNRFGFIISKKTEKKAVMRNRAKRVIRACIEKMLDRICAGYDMLFIIQKKAVGEKQELICSDMQQLLKQAKLLK